MFKGVSFIPETTFSDIYFKSVREDNVTSCWDQCEKEVVCNSISFYNGSEPLFYNHNCLLYTNESPETKKSKNFVTKARKPKSNFNIFVDFIKNLLILLE